METEVSWNRECMRFLGVWPDPKLTRKTDDKWAMCKCLVPGVMMITVINIPQTMRLVTVLHDLDEVVEILMKFLLPFVACLIKLVYLWLNKEVMRPVVASLMEDWRTPKTESEKKMMLKNAQLSRRMCTICFVMAYLVILLYSIFHAFNETRRRLSNDNFTEQNLLVHANYGFATSSVLIYVLICILQVLATMYAALSYLTADGFVTMLVLHLCAQLAIQRSILENFSRNGRNRNREFRDVLKSLVMRHEHLCWFADMIENSFNNAFLGQILVCTVQFCFLGFQFLVTLMTGTKEMIIIQGCCVTIFTGTMLLIPFIYCYLGECLYDQSMGLCCACYECEWYNLSAQEAKCLLLIMIRSQYPLRITAGRFFAFSFETFTEILKSSAGYLSVLIAVKSRLLEEEDF